MSACVYVRWNKEGKGLTGLQQWKRNRYGRGERLARPQLLLRRLFVTTEVFGADLNIALTLDWSSLSGTFVSEISLMHFLFFLLRTGLFFLFFSYLIEGSRGIYIYFFYFDKIISRQKGFTILHFISFYFTYLCVFILLIHLHIH